ncbi:MAG: aldose 1-epimerase family protein, partial [Patescibacteria group bacterium]|nr:aldose 1-epimerase family protein [Patescibacteria group bacterium]
MITWEGVNYSKEEFQRAFGKYGEILCRERPVGIRESVFTGPMADLMPALELRPTQDFVVRIAPQRALEPLEIRFDCDHPPFMYDRSAMFENFMGAVSPWRFESIGLGTLIGIQAFFTCGPDHVGSPTPLYSLHGYFSRMPAQNVRSFAEWQNENLCFITQGEIDCRRMVVGPWVRVSRTVRTVLGENKFWIHDVLTADHDSKIMWKYHPNFPLIDPSELIVAAEKVVARDTQAEVDLDRWNYVDAINDEIAERVYHIEYVPAKNIAGVPDGMVHTLISYDRGNTGAYIAFNTNQFKDNMRFLTIWKNTRDAVMGLEPGATVLGRDYAEEHNLLVPLKKGETIEFDLEVGFLSSPEEVSAMKKIIGLVRAAKIKAEPLIIPSIEKKKYK